ncbi:MAG: restriction endonuclease subunit S [Agathobacter sp.]
MLKAYEEYKYADIPWCTEIPYSWSVNRGKAIFNNPKEINKEGLCGNVLSLTLKGVIRNNTDNPVGLTPKSYETYQIFEKNNLVFKLIDLENISTSRVGLVKEKGIMSPAYIRIELKNIESHNMKFFFYQYYSMYKRNIFNGLGAGVRQTLSGDDLLVIKIAVPPKPEQNQIVRYLDWKTSEMNRFIHQKKKQIKMLRELRLSLIDNAVTKGIDNVELKESGYGWIGKIPKHWNMEYSKHFFFLRKEKAHIGDEQLTSSQQYGIISQKKFMEIENRRVTVVMTGDDILKHVEAGDFVISMRSFQGGIEYSSMSGKISSAYVMLIPNHEFVNDEYFRWLLKSPSYIKALQGTSDLVRDGQALRYSNFAKVYLPRVPLDEQQRIAEYLNQKTPQIDEAITEIKKEISLVEELKVKLISDVVTGQVDVRDEVIPNYEVDSSDDEVEDDVDEESSDENIDEG